MRLILLALLVVPSILPAQTKQKAPAFGKVDKSDLEMSSCEFDKDAEAVVLSDVGKNYLDIRNGHISKEFQRHIRIKILKQDGLDQGNVKLRYISYLNEEHIFNLQANTYNLDASGNITVSKLEKDLVYEKKITSRTTEQSFTLPDVKVGSVIEYKYTVRGSLPRNWNLQSSIPVRYSSYEINFPSLFELYIEPLCTLPYKADDESNGLRTIKTFSMQNIPALRDERFLSSENDYLQRIESYITAVNIDGRREPTLVTWKDVATMLLDDEDFGRQLNKNIPRTADLDATLKSTSGDFNRMVAIHDYVRKNMKWDGVDNIWALNGVKSAWNDKVGTSGEINLILVNLLKDARLKAYPIMLSTHENGVVSLGFPQTGYFNKVMALVEIGDKRYILDGTDKFTPATVIPFDVMCGEGLVIDGANENKFRWHQVWDENLIDKNTVIVSAWVGSDGLMKGFANISHHGYGRVKRAPTAAKGEDAYLAKYYRGSQPGLVADSLSFTNNDIDSLPLHEKFVFSLPLNSSGDYTYFSPNLFSGLEKNPFVADTRYSDVFFGSNQQHTIIASFHLPDGYQLEELPKNVKMTMEDRSLSVSRMSSYSGNVLSTRITIDCKRPMYTVAEYPDLKEFYKQLYGLLDEQFVIRKGNATASNTK